MRYGIRATRGQCRGSVAALCGALALTGGATALAAHPKPAKSYAGIGRLCQNNAPHRRFRDCRGRDGFSFHTSANGSRVIGFAGTIGPLYCGGATLTITARFMAVARDGSFAYAFIVTARGPKGRVRETSHVQIRGRFTGSGRTASLFYRLVSHAGGTPGRQDCGAQVSGTARTG